MKKQKTSKKWLLKIIFALIVGFINGFFGGGGGLIVVPVLEKIYNLPTKKAHATAIFIMLPLSIISSIIYILNNDFKIFITISVTFGVLLGGLIGAVLLKKLNTSIVRWIFIIILFTAGVRMIV